MQKRAQFPIPKTVFVEITGWKGSTQIYLSNTKSLEDIQLKQLPCSKILLQKLVIYDLLFSNCNRHEDNLLFKEVIQPAEYQAYGIDHDKCMQGFGESLKFEYLALIGQNDIFEESLIELISQENLDRYAEIMKAHQMPEESTTWLYEVALIQEEEINTVKEKWDDYY